MTNSYTGKTLSDLSIDEMQDVKKNLLENKAICPHCLEWVAAVRHVPTRFLYKPSMSLFRSDSAYTQMLLDDYEKKRFACDYCISSMAQKRRVQLEATRLESIGIITTSNYYSYTGKKDTGIQGFVYIAQWQDGQYKIGSTTRSVRSRLIQNELYTPDSFIHAILTHCPRRLEAYLHNRYEKNNVKMGEGWFGQKEVFVLSEKELQWIRSLQSVDGKIVSHFAQLKLAIL